MNRVKVFSMCAYVGFAHLGTSKFGYDYVCACVYEVCLKKDIFLKESKCENAKRLRSTLKRNLKEKKNTHTHTHTKQQQQTNETRLTN